MAVWAVDNGSNVDLSVSKETLPDGGDAQRVVVIPADDTPVAISAGNSRWGAPTTVLVSSKLPGLGESYAILEAQVADMLYWLDGKDPAVTPGHILSAGYSIRLSGAAMTNCKVVQAAAGAICCLSAFKKPAT